MERGDDQFSEYKDNVGVYSLYRQGKHIVIMFLTSVLQAIAELEEIGIYHADIIIRNFIQFNNVFEIIDFNHALLSNIDIDG
jgi:tRNA A-37 threonylcarbamoyl transferase component Bud32